MDVANEILTDKTSTIPSKLTTLHACRVCALVKEQAQFDQFGCNNCSQGDPKIWSAASSGTMTTPIFSGYVPFLAMSRTNAENLPSLCPN
jgi:hypothetical protein